MMVPTVHLNGDSIEELLRVHDELSATLNIAQTELQRCAPNARNFYVQGPDAYRQARAEHDTRVAALQKLVDDVYALQRGIEAQRRVRRADPGIVAADRAFTRSQKVED